MSRLTRLLASWVVCILSIAQAAYASNFKTVCSSGCDYTSLQSAINAVPTRSTPGDGASSPWVIQVQIGVLGVDTSITINNKSYLTVEGIGAGATFVQATSTWFGNATGSPADRFLTISNSDHVTLRNITIDAATNTPVPRTINADGNGVAGVFLQHADPVFIDSASIVAYEWGLRDAWPEATDPANGNNVQILNSRITSQYIASWVTGGSTWLVWNTEFRAEGDLTGNTPPAELNGLYVTGARPSGARNVFTGWGCHFHAESPFEGNVRGVVVLGPNISDVTAVVGSTIHAKSKATSGSTTVNAYGLYVNGGSAANAANIDVSGSEIIYEGPAGATSGAFVGVQNNLSQVTINLTGTSIIDRARDDSTTPPTLAGSTHKDILRAQGPSGTYPSRVRVVGSRAVSMTGHSSSPVQALDTPETQSGSVQLSSGTVTVTLPVALPSSKYRIALSVNANETVWVDPSTVSPTCPSPCPSMKTGTKFTLLSSNPSSSATVDWIVRY